MKRPELAAEARLIDTSLAWSRVKTTVDVGIDHQLRGRVHAEVQFAPDPPWSGHVGSTRVVIDMAGVTADYEEPDGALAFMLSSPDDVEILAAALTALHEQMTRDNVTATLRPAEVA